MAQYASPYLGMGNNPVSFIDPTGGMDGDGQTKPIDPKAAEQIKQMRDQFGSNFGGIEWQDIIATMSQNEGSGWNRTHAWLMSGSNMGYDSWVGDLNRQMAEIGMVYSEKRNAYGKWADLEFASTGKTHIEGGSIVKFTTELTSRWIPFSGNVAQSGGGRDNSAAAAWSNVNTGIGAFDVGAGAKGELINYAAKSSPAINDLKYVKGIKALGYATYGVSSAISVGLAGNYYANGGTDASVGIKASIDVIMGGVGFLGPIGFGVSATYFLLDAGGAFGGYGDPLLTPNKVR